MFIKSFGITDIGSHREENQDAYYLDDQSGIYLVADGMGGMEFGKETAEFIADSFCGILGARLSETGGIGLPVTSAVLAETMDILNEEVRERISPYCGSTIVAAVKSENRLFVVNLGDSPAYLFRDGRLIQVTREHNMAGLLVESGDLTPEEAKVHPSRHQLTAYVGMRGKAETFVTMLLPEAGDRLLLCTDGLTGMVPEKEIAGVLKEEKDIAAASERLVRMANEAGGYDNITVVLAEYQS